MNSTAMNTFLNSSVFIFTLFQLLPSLSSESEQVRVALVRFMSRISVGEIPRMVNFGWNITSDPCADKWQGISCDSNFHVRKIVLDHFNLTGVLDAASLCSPHTLTVLSLNHNSVVGVLPEDISNCTRLTHLFLLGNNFSGSLPTTLPRLSSLKRLVISDNAFSGEVPVEMTTISGLLTFLADNNRLTGEIPSFNFSKLAEFNVSYNNFSGPIPDTSGSNFSSSSFLGNTRLCGEVISKPCPSPPLQPKTQKNISFLIFLGYVALGVVVILLAAFISIKRCNPKKSRRKESSSSENSITTPENESDSSFEILSSPVMNKELKFDDLLGAPAELLGKGKHGSAYKVTVVDSGVKFVVKRIRGWDIPKQDFKNRMLRINAVQHPNVLRLVAFYCSTQEKLLVYEYQHNGSLFSLLHGSKNEQPFGWESRLGIAARTAAALAFMHESLHHEAISHGNLKSTNILMNKKMDPCISEYGLMINNSTQDQLSDAIRPDDPVAANAHHAFKIDVYSFGLVLLELLTGKPVETCNLAKWVNSVVREEWSCEVFDKALISEGGSEDRMVNLLQVALRCINPSPEDRPSMRQVAEMISFIKEDEDITNVISSEDTIS